MSIDETIVSFDGPFSWAKDEKCPNLFRQNVANKAGLYLWTVPQSEGELIYYVGITERSFKKRMEEHFKEHCAGAYHLNEPEALRNGTRKCLWPGFYDRKDKKGIADIVEIYGAFANIIVDLLHTYRFYLAPLVLETRRLERIEEALMKHLYNQSGKVGSFQEEDILHKPRTDSEIPFNVRFQEVPDLIGIPQIMEA